MKRTKLEMADCYVVFLFGKVVGGDLAPHVHMVHREFCRGWNQAADEDRELENLAINVLADRRRRRPPGACF